MSAVTIEVTAEDIAAGVPHSPNSCPVALAAKRVTDRALMAGSLGFHLMDGAEEMVRYPSGVTSWITGFDQGEPVQPFTFTVEVPA